MEVKDYLLDEIKRINRRNDIMEKQLNSGTTIIDLHIEETIKNNALAMCEIAKTLYVFKELKEDIKIDGKKVGKLIVPSIKTKLDNHD